MALERRYRLTRVASGDYLLWGNDGHRLFRMTRSTDGWDLYEHTSPLPRYMDVADWSAWTCVAQLLRTREEAISEVVRMTDQPTRRS